jgi:hypothetical protein
MFQSFFVTWHFVRGVEDAPHRTDARNYDQRHRPVAFATEGLRLVLCFAFNCGIRVELNLFDKPAIRVFQQRLVEDAPLGFAGRNEQRAFSRRIEKRELRHGCTDRLSSIFHSDFKI